MIISLSYAVKDAHKKVEFVPGCLVATSESTTWAKLFEFGRRQFVITRFYGAERCGHLVCSAAPIRSLDSGGRCCGDLRRNHAESAHLAFYRCPRPVFYHAAHKGDTQTKYGKQIIRGGLAKIENRGNCRYCTVLALVAAYAHFDIVFGLWQDDSLARIRYKLISKTETIVLGT